MSPAASSSAACVIVLSFIRTCTRVSDGAPFSAQSLVRLRIEAGQGILDRDGVPPPEPEPFSAASMTAASGDMERNERIICGASVF